MHIGIMGSVASYDVGVRRPLLFRTSATPRPKPEKSDFEIHYTRVGILILATPR